MNDIEQKIYDILLEKQQYLKEQKGIDELYFGTEYAKRICDHNGYTPEQVTTAIKSLRKNGFIMGKTQGKEGVYGYMTIVPRNYQSVNREPSMVGNSIPQRDEKQQIDWDEYRQYQKEHENDPLPFEPVYDTNNKPDKVSDNDTKIDNYSTYTFQSGYTQFIITVAA